MIVTITSGAHGRSVKPEGGPHNFAHLFDPDSAEDVPHQAQNFITYANALGASEAPHVLIAPPLGEGSDADLLLTEMCDWAELVQSSTGTRVVLQVGTG